MSQTLPPQPIRNKDLMAPHRIVRLVLVGLSLAVVAAAVTWEVVRVTAAPELTITAPVDNLLTADHRITLAGHAAAGATVTANGAVVPISLDGKFSEEMDLRTGANVITIVASKKFAKPNIIYRRVVVTQ